MKRFIAIMLLFFGTTSCFSQNKNESGIRSLSLEECYKKNLADSTLMTGWYYLSDADSGFVRQLDKTNEFYTINPFPIVTAEDMTVLSIEKNRRGDTFLVIKFGKAGTELWRMATKKTVGKKLALIVNDKLIYAPLVNSEITAGVSALNRGDYSKEEYEKIKQAIENNRAQMQKGSHFF